MLTNRTEGDYVDRDLPTQLSNVHLESPFPGVLCENVVLEGLAPLSPSHRGVEGLSLPGNPSLHEEILR